MSPGTIRSSATSTTSLPPDREHQRELERQVEQTRRREQSERESREHEVQPEQKES